MNKTISLLVLTGLIACQNPPENTESPEKVVQEKWWTTPHLITIEEAIAGHAAGRDWVWIDIRKAENFAEGHVQGAHNIWRDDIQNMDTSYEGLMAGREQMEALMQKLGVNTGDTILIYDDKANVDAARFWWIMQVYGNEAVVMMNGGLHAWKNAGGAVVTSETAASTAGNFTLPETGNNALYISLADAKTTWEQESAFWLDTRNTAEYSGAETKQGAAYGGHIPGAQLIDYADAYQYHGDQGVKSKAELEALYAGYLNSDKNIVTYCHSGVRSAYTTFVLTELLGLKNVKNFDGSWVEWSHFDLPAESDSTEQ
jgi:thiosulfate/3-mercaptopyruvate sulfurtransferase